MTIVSDVQRQGVAVQQRRRTKERRLSQRLPLAVPIFARGHDELGKEFLEFTTTLNISASGALLAMRRYLAPDTSITLEIPAAPLPRLSLRPRMVRTLQAQVVRVIRSEPSYLWALSFSHPIT
ncbi:MAG: PilZ domain-containing protein [Terriglobia bacterium]